MKKTPLEKRIKRRITGRKHIFFAICAPGLEALCLREIKNLPMQLEMVSMTDGGVEFTGYIHDCYYANLFLRSPSRLLMRIAEFKAENFRTLEKKLNAIDWELFLKKENNIKCHVTCHHSRLYHKSAITGKTEKIITSYFEKYSAEKIHENTQSHNKKIKRIDNSTTGKINRPETDGINKGLADPTNKRGSIFIRATDNRFVVSIDSSGDLLHKRGKKTCVGKAPVRENLAFALLDSAGYSGKEPLIDPMCGSGTFSLEAAMIMRNIPPGFFRNFAFQDWPCFSRKRWDYLKKKAGSSILPTPSAPNIFASDIDPDVIKNLKKTVMAYDLSSSIKIHEKDFFNIIPENFTKEKGIVVLNPPYGKRMGYEKELSSFFLKTGSKLKKNFKGWKIIIILPKKKFARLFPFPVALKPFSHGGLRLFAATGKIT